jgi:hypothetical protein
VENPVIVLIWIENDVGVNERLTAKTYKSDGNEIIEYPWINNDSNIDLSKEKKLLEKLITDSGIIIFLIKRSEFEAKLDEEKLEGWQELISDNPSVYPRIAVGYQNSQQVKTDKDSAFWRLLGISKHLTYLKKSDSIDERRKLARATPDWNMKSILSEISNDLEIFSKVLKKDLRKRVNQLEKHEKILNVQREQQQVTKKRIAALKKVLAKPLP